MKKWKMNSWFAFLGSVLAHVAVMPVATVAAQESNLSGVWAIVEDASDAPADVLDVLAQRRSANSGVGVGVGIFGVPVELARTGGRGRAPEEVVRRDLRRLPPHLYNFVDALEIEQAPVSLRIRYGDRNTVSYPNGETLEIGDGTSIADWRRNVYTVVRRVTDELRATEEIYLDRNDANRLHWLVTLELASLKTVRIRRVYDRVAQP